MRLLLALLASALLALPLLAQEGLDLDRVKELKDKGKLHFDESANVDLSTSKRNQHRKEAYGYLTEAFRILDEWCESHPADAERFEDLMVEIHKMRYWLRKESPIGLLEDDDSNVRKGTPPGWPEKPPEDLDQPALPPGEKPPAQPTEPAEPVKPPAPATDPVEENLKYAAEYARKHPYDLAGIRDLYLDILEHVNPGTAAYVTALKKVSAINEKLKAAYRLLRNEDPDTLDLTGAEERRMVHDIAQDLEHDEADVRLRAAEYLGLLGCGDGARHVVEALKREDDERVREMGFSALAAIGGSKTTSELVKLRRVRKEWLQVGAMGVLEKLVRKNPVDARYAAIALGDFVFSRFDTVSDQALALLEGLGPAGTLGLMNAITLKDHEKRLRIIRALGETGDGRAADVLGAFLILGAKGRLREYQEAAKEAIKKIGMPAVPYLARFVQHPRNGQWTRFLLREITGVTFKSEAAVRAWWKGQDR